MFIFAALLDVIIILYGSEFLHINGRAGMGLDRNFMGGRTWAGKCNGQAVFRSSENYATKINLKNDDNKNDEENIQLNQLEQAYYVDIKNIFLIAENKYKAVRLEINSDNLNNNVLHPDNAYDIMKELRSQYGANLIQSKEALLVKLDRVTIRTKEGECKS
eukprot:Pgem_evm2s17935